MGFDVNFNNNKPIIKGAQTTQDGGAGNLGYFKKQKQQDEEENEKSLFKSKDEHDTFSKSDDIVPEEDFSLSKLIAQFIFDIKDWFKKVFKF